MRSRSLNNQRKVYEHILASTDKPRVLDIGCGVKKFSPAYGIDLSLCPGVDVVADVDSFGLPFRDGSFNMVVANHFVEHVSDVRAFMMELHRVLSPGGLAVIRTPYFAHEGSFRDPSHRWHLTLKSMDYFLAGNCLRWGRLPGYFEKVSEKLEFGKDPWQLIGRVLCHISASAYESNFAHVFPAKVICWTLKAI